jgi:hypothetical protein
MKKKILIQAHVHIVFANKKVSLIKQNKGDVVIDLLLLHNSVGVFSQSKYMKCSREQQKIC